MSLIGSTLSAASSVANAILGDALAPYALFSIQGRVIGTIAVDVPLREVHNDTFVVTQHPVEGGTPIADHYFSNPKMLEMSVGYSDSTAGFEGYCQQVYASFIALAATRQPFSVSTGKRQYDNLMFADISVITDPVSEYALFLTARFQEVIITATDTGSSSGDMTQANQANPSETAPTTNSGNQSLQSTGTESETAASAKAATIAGYSTPVTTPASSAAIGSA